MLGRHFQKNRHFAPVTGAVLAGAFAGSLALVPPGGGSGGSDGTGSAAHSANSARQAASHRDEPAPSKPPEDCKPSKERPERPNGRIPLKELCPLPQEDESLRADAAVAFYKLNAAYQERFGEEICVRSSYRSYERQAELYESMPAGMAARPGNSKHGRGIAVDLCGGVQDDETPQFKWMADNSEKYAWIHPDWAYSNPYEPWHWEFDVGQDD